MPQLSKHDIENFKPYIEKAVDRYLGSKDNKVISSTISYLVDGYDKKKVSEKLSTYMDTHRATKLADKVFEYLSDVQKNSSKHSGSKRRHDYDEKFDNTDAKRNRGKEDSKRRSDHNHSDNLSSYQIKEMMVQAQKMIEERKKALTALGIGKIPQIGPTLPEQVALTLAQQHQQQQQQKEAEEKTRKIAQLQAQIQTKLTKTGMSLPALPSKPTPLILDKEGRTVDSTGKEIQLTQRMPTLKANIRAIKREQFKQQLLQPPSEESNHSRFFDPRVGFKTFQRSKRSFQFHEQGKFVQHAQRLRAKAQLDKLQNEIAEIAKKTGISSETKLALIAPKTKLLSEDYTPDIEWWDSVITRNSRFGNELQIQGVTNLVEHPAQIKCFTSYKMPQISAFLTKKEQRKLRRMNRREAWKEKQEKIRLGLEPPPEPKLRLSNLMRAIGTQAVQDPTKMEAHVRDQMARRQKAHEEANTARKLSAQQRREKKIRKLREDTSAGVYISVYRIRDLSNLSKKFKVEKNAQQLQMTGTIVLYKDVNVVIVEGGPKQQKKYRRLLMNRIKWTDEEGCTLVWEGRAKHRNFAEVRYKICPTEAMARDHLKKHTVEHYWDLAYSGAVLEQTEDT